MNSWYPVTARTNLPLNLVSRARVSRFPSAVSLCMRSATVTGRYRLSMPAAATRARRWLSAPGGRCRRVHRLLDPPRVPASCLRSGPPRDRLTEGDLLTQLPGLVLRRSGARGLPDGFARVRIGSCLELVQHLAIDAVQHREFVSRKRIEHLAPHGADVCWCGCLMAARPAVVSTTKAPRASSGHSSRSTMAPILHPP